MNIGMIGRTLADRFAKAGHHVPLSSVKLSGLKPVAIENKKEVNLWNSQTQPVLLLE
jgi:predicted dinucleotide-binding enzyme